MKGFTYLVAAPEFRRQVELGDDDYEWLEEQLFLLWLRTGKMISPQRSYMLVAVKIGKAIEVDSRLPNLQTGCPLWHEKLLVLSGAHIESELHSRYESRRIRGEWYELSRIDVELINLRYGSNNGALPPQMQLALH